MNFRKFNKSAYLTYNLQYAQKPKESQFKSYKTGIRWIHFSQKPRKQIK